MLVRSQRDEIDMLRYHNTRLRLGVRQILDKAELGVVGKDAALKGIAKIARALLAL
jgi:hypothetical protein